MGKFRCVDFIPSKKYCTSIAELAYVIRNTQNI
jgi:hypothetical protein